jgi:hypothetical protein
VVRTVDNPRADSNKSSHILHENGTLMTQKKGLTQIVFQAYQSAFIQPLSKSVSLPNTMFLLEM